MGYRFERDETNESMTSVNTFRAQLEYLRKQGYAFVSLSSLVNELTADRTPLKNAVAFTVDDGYADFRDLGAPEIGRASCRERV